MRSHDSTVGWRLDGVRMHVTSTASAGVVNSETTFTFHQDGSRVWCRYTGGDVIDGFLLGSIAGDSLRFGYVQYDRDGRLDAGMSEGSLTMTTDGRIRMEEHFRWLTREGSGVNVFEELPHRMAAAESFDGDA
ncbi:MAG TPA: hypothetical protein VJW73_19505 [Gemmatimonadaceae bacterium]|nr:hypothetical protein [Gemmatimonadaceae bacterium]